MNSTISAIHLLSKGPALEATDSIVEYSTGRNDGSASIACLTSIRMFACCSLSEGEESACEKRIKTSLAVVGGIFYVFLLSVHLASTSSSPCCMCC